MENSARRWQRVLPQMRSPRAKDKSMIIGLGLDLVEISRIADSWQRFGQKFAQRVLHPLELADLPELPERTVQYLAARFAAKEAAVKALGTGFAQGIGPHSLYVRKLPSGQPEMVFLDKALEKMYELGADSSLLSLTHGRESAAAVLVLTRRGALQPGAEQ